jgi:hypothetical protein
VRPVPVKAVGKKVIEVATGKVVAHSSSEAKAKKYARIRNWKHAEKLKKKGR